MTRRHVNRLLAAGTGSGALGVGSESRGWPGDTPAALHDEGFVFVHPDQVSLN